MSTPDRLGGIIHIYQKYDPVNFPSPTAPPPDMVSPAFEHLLFYGNTRRLTEEEEAELCRFRHNGVDRYLAKLFDDVGFPRASPSRPDRVPRARSPAGSGPAASRHHCSRAAGRTAAPSLICRLW